jgi:uncharacterized protein YigE (DUF2233 family)
MNKDILEEHSEKIEEPSEKIEEQSEKIDPKLLRQIKRNQTYLSLLLLINILLQVAPHLQSVISYAFIKNKPQIVKSSTLLPEESETNLLQSQEVSAGTLEIGISHDGKKFRALIVDLAKNKIELFLNQKDPKTQNNFLYLENKLLKNKKKLAFATNAGMFEPDHKPVGLHVENGKLIKEIVVGNPKAQDGNFYLLPNAVFHIENQSAYITDSTLLKDKKDWTSTALATQSGPALILGGEINNLFDKESKNLNIRSGVGIIDKQKVVFVISDEPINFYDFAQIFQDKYGCKDALYLDGVISKMYLPELNKGLDDYNFGGILAITQPDKN